MTWKSDKLKIDKSNSKAKPITPEQLASRGTEDGHQMALFCWVAMNYEAYPQLRCLFAIPNGGSRHIAEAVKMVGAGTRSGVPDTFLACPMINHDGVYINHGLFIEMKREKYRSHKNGGCSDEQMIWINRLKNYGYAVEVCYNWIEARDKIMKYIEGTMINGL